MPEPCLKTDSYINPVGYANRIIDEYENFIRWVIRSQNTTNISEDDLFQDFYLELISTPIPITVRSVRRYIYQAIINLLSDSYREMRAYETKIKKFHKNSNFSVNKFDPANALLIEEEMNRMFERIRAISPGQRYMAITLRYRYGYSIQEVADKMGIKYTSVLSYISKGLGKVRQCLNNT